MLQISQGEFTTRQEYFNYKHGAVLKPHINWQGWYFSDEKNKFVAGWFKTKSDRSFFLDKLSSTFKEVDKILIAPLLVLCNTSDPDSAAYRFSIGHLEKLLDEQDTMNVARSTEIHNFVFQFIAKSTDNNYDIHKRFEKLKL